MIMMINVTLLYDVYNQFYNDSLIHLAPNKPMDVRITIDERDSVISIKVSVLYLLISVAIVFTFLNQIPFSLIIGLCFK